jgi:DUF4097 and DUF4098 domain-containing protein YvlB
MTTFSTPNPITATIDIVGPLRITASDRSDTVVVIRPGNPARPADVKAAEQTTVEFNDGRLLLQTPKDWRRYTPFGGKETVEVTIELPTGSMVTADTALGDLSADGELGECRLKTAAGNIRLDHTGPLRASTGFGSVSVDRVDGDAEITTGTGELRVGHVEGTAVIRNANGRSTIGEVRGDLRVKASNGDVSVGRAHASVVAKSANGNVRVGEVARGTVVVESAAGELEVGVRAGTAAWLDVHTRFGAVHNNLGTGVEPTPADPIVEVRARTSAGNILINRSC